MTILKQFISITTHEKNNVEGGRKKNWQYQFSKTKQPSRTVQDFLGSWVSNRNSYFTESFKTLESAAAKFQIKLHHFWCNRGVNLTLSFCTFTAIKLIIYFALCIVTIICKYIVVDGDDGRFIKTWLKIKSNRFVFENALYYNRYSWATKWKKESLVISLISQNTTSKQILRRDHGIEACNGF